MRKSILSSLLLAGSFLLFQNSASASEIDASASQSSESTDDIIYFDATEQDVLITDEMIIRAVRDEDRVNSLSRIHSLSNEYNEGYESLLNGEVDTLAGNGVWDMIGYQYVYSKSEVYPSSGGDYLVEINQEINGPIFYRLKEKDTNSSDNVGNQFMLSGAELYSIEYRDITKYCDGDDGLAEFYMEKQTHTSNGTFMVFYD